MQRRFSSVLALAACMATVACGSTEPRPRRIALVSPDRRVDEALRVARQSEQEGMLDRADSALRSILTAYPADPVCPMARVMLAAVTLARGDLRQAEDMARTSDVSVDPALARSARLVLGVAATREGRDSDALTLLRPLEGQLPDKAETGELSCALAESEARAGDPERALRAIAASERLAHEVVPWLPTSLSCEQVSTRIALAERVAPHVQDPQALADVLDTLPSDSQVRRPLEVQLREIANTTHTTARWLGYLGDLPDDGDDATGVPVARAARLVVGVLGPMSGARSIIGVAILRGVQYGLENTDDTRVVLEDEGDSPTDAVDALDRLAGQGARAVIGVAREELTAAVAIRAQALGVELWLIAPSRGVEGAGPHVHIAGPIVDDRVGALVAAARARTPRVEIVTPHDPLEIDDALRAALEHAGISTVTEAIADFSPTVANNGIVHVVAGVFGQEARAAMARAAEHAPTRWIVEARSAEPGSSGTWIGVRAGPAFPEVLNRFCTRVGEPPDEMALLAHDAARAAVAFARSTPVPSTALAQGDPFVSATVTANGHVTGDLPAAAWRCPTNSAP